MTDTSREKAREAPSLVVALETSTRPASIAVQGPAGQRAALTLEEDRRHASDLLGALGELVERVGAIPSDLDLVIAGTGPGSYTGLRVGASTALGLMRGAGAEVLGLPSFDAIAADGLAAGERGAVLRKEVARVLLSRVLEAATQHVRRPVCPASVAQPRREHSLQTETAQV